MINYRVLCKPNFETQFRQLPSQCCSESSVRNPILYRDLHYMIPSQYELITVIPLAFEIYPQSLCYQKNLVHDYSLSENSQNYCFHHINNEDINQNIKESSLNNICSSLNNKVKNENIANHKMASSFSSTKYVNLHYDSTDNEISYKKKSKPKKEDKDYERQNVYYKTILRDFRRFIAEDFNNFVNLNKELLFSSVVNSCEDVHQELNTNKYSSGYFGLKGNQRSKVLVEIAKEYSIRLIQLHSYFKKGKKNDINNLDYNNTNQIAINSETVTLSTDDFINTVCCLISHKDYKKTQYFKQSSDLIRAKSSIKISKSEQNLSNSFLIDSENDLSGYEELTSNKYENSKRIDPNYLHSTLKVFTQKKMDYLFSNKSLKFLFKYYASHEKINSRMRAHKSMQKQIEKFDSILSKMVALCE